MSKKIKNPVKNVIFDLDGTLIHQKPHLVNIIQNVLKQKQLFLSTSELNESGRWYHEFWNLQSTYDRDPDRDDSNDRIKFWSSYLDHYKKYFNHLNGGFDTLFIKLVYEIEEQKGKDYIFDETESVISNLLRKGYRLGILSNRYSTLTNFVDDHYLGKYFECALSAGDLGASKPDSEIFIKFLQLFQADPDTCLYVGDNYWLDYLGAENAGWQAVLLDVYGWYDCFELLKIKTITELSHIL